MRFSRVSAAALACSAGLGSAQGQIVSDVAANLLDPVIVAGRAQDVDRTAASISVLLGEDIERLNALRLGDVL
ncbi:MAG: hypothetical protein AAFS13_10015, partial [Pseudomonadota bacterium]